jgi:hypothetical protein
VNTGQRLACSRQLTAAEAAQWSDPGFVLNGWVPATLNAAVAGTRIDVNWSAPPGHSAADLIALCPARAPWCVAAKRAGSTATLGTESFPLPRARGVYQVRYYANGHLTAASAAFTTGGSR